MIFQLMIVAGTTLAALSSAAAQTDWKADATAAAVAFHRADTPPDCVKMEVDVGGLASHELQIGEETAARQALLIEFPCRQGAYNTSSVFVMSDQKGTVSEVLFPSPVVNVRYAKGSSDSVVEAMTITETLDLREVVNPVYDPDSREMVERDKWRGRDDAYAATHWSYKDGRFQITLFAVDATFDGQDNPQTLIQRDIW